MPLLDLTNEAFLTDPYPRLAELREAGPIHYDPDLDLWLLTRHRDIHAALRDRRLGRVRRAEAIADDFRPLRELDLGVDPTPYLDVERHSLLMLEPPEHTRIRALIGRAFTPRRIRELRGPITQLADRLLGSINAGARFNLLADYAQPFSVGVIAELLGAPVDSADDLLRWSHAIVKMYELSTTTEQVEQAIAASAEFRAWTLNLIEGRRARPREDLFSGLVHTQDNEDRLSDDEIVSTVILLLNAGHEATVNTMGNGMAAVLNHADAWPAIVAGRVPPDAAVEEMIRWDPPLQLFERWVLDDEVEIAGQRLSHHDKLGMLFGAANRDPRQFDSPDTFDIGRNDASHVTFGGGIHYCLGAPLARLELSVAVGRLAAHFPSLTLQAPPRRIPAFVIRGYESVTVGSR